jgi:hypothetical protein
MAIILKATVIYSINGISQQFPVDYTVYVECSVGDIISPFNQDYKYKVRSVIASLNNIAIDLEPFCENAKKVYMQQYGPVYCKPREPLYLECKKLSVLLIEKIVKGDIQGDEITEMLMEFLKTRKAPVTNEGQIKGEVI